jgi:hypothetical protein
MNRCDEIERLPHPHPARQHGNVSDEAHIADKTIALPPRISPEDPEVPLVGCEADDCVQRGGLAGAVGTDQPDDATFVHA